MQIKSWESPRRRGRNDKGQGGSARQRQLKKRDKMLRNKLKRDAKVDNGNGSDKQNQQNKRNGNGGEINLSPLFYCPNS
ncbi:MAG: hypothetical protein WBB82_01775 [Limnothrix sp.]